MKFSIIIPTYNEENYIEDCLNSIRSQQFDPAEFELIVADAGSSDNTVSLAKNLSAKVVVTSQRGIAHGRNVGAQQASGDLLLFVDADVTLGKTFLQKLYLRFQDPLVLGVTGRALPVDGAWFPRFIYHATYALVEFCGIFGLSLFPGLCVAYRKTAFVKVNGFKENFGISEDLDLSRRISSIGKCIYEKEARALVSTRRLQRHAVSTVVFHLYHDIRFLLTGRSAKVYPKSEEIQTSGDLWKMNRK